MTPNERYKKLKQHLKEENPVLLDVINEYENLDKVAHSLGLLAQDESYTANISWWPLISILGTFSAGKSTFINEYLGQKVQQSGNQAVDDKFTVICYSNNEKVTTLPGLALDADPRFPFYNISEEVEKVEQGEGSRVNLYLQLKTVKSDAIKGGILIDSPGFDADSQRDSILRITSHIIDMSDLVLIFFDARHPEPGAMRDTLEHLVGKTVRHRDGDKILYILNQIDTTAREDNLEDVIGSWQRALSQKGLISGNFFAIYSEEAMNPIDDPSIAERLKRKRDEDLNHILERMEGVKVERAYRISKALEDFAKDIINNKLPKLRESLSRWGKRVVITDTLLSLIFIGGAGALFMTGILPTSVEVIGGISAAITVLIIFIHFKVRKVYANLEIKRWAEKDQAIAKAIEYNTKWFRPVLRVWGKGWSQRVVDKLENIMDYSRAAIRKLNDQFVSPAGKESET
ncbi:dynamin family protein [Hydrogenimonas thermophila]|uniref:Dynamin family protein n=1 Tax=Hydrogenimonas thermophila TaxID=223786 RepID=A0A1I5P170_9BACT|nr:dynamin family protein [Hydrogenimonas thermophila]WOE69568.1 dynamin family protein [Hydrogenimonas thermophila]WOE72082.1 dynamin family protein [Hydrogenimonas thermophila]SFP27753.1 Dynamin family protein [Hydrogenimonas thermophila]